MKQLDVHQTMRPTQPPRYNVRLWRSQHAVHNRSVGPHQDRNPTGHRRTLLGRGRNPQELGRDLKHWERCEYCCEIINIVYHCIMDYHGVWHEYICLSETTVQKSCRARSNHHRRSTVGGHVAWVLMISSTPYSIWLLQVVLNCIHQDYQYEW